MHVNNTLTVTSWLALTGPRRDSSGAYVGTTTKGRTVRPVGHPVLRFLHRSLPAFLMLDSQKTDRSIYQGTTGHGSDKCGIAEAPRTRPLLSGFPSRSCQYIEVPENPIQQAMIL